MSLLPADAGFEELVQDCFLALHGSGVMLSPLDAELVSEWASLGVPYEVVARGIQRAAERALWDARPGDPPLHTLRACKRAVAVEIKKYLDRSAGRAADAPDGEPGESLEQARHRKLKAALRKFKKLEPAYAAATERLLSAFLAAPAADLPGAARQEDAVIAALARAMPYEARAGLAREVRERIGLSPTLSARARRLSRRFHRAALLRERLDLPTFW